MNGNVARTPSTTQARGRRQEGDKRAEHADGVRVVMTDNLFVPHWEVPEPRGDLRAPLFRENGIAIEDQSPAPPPANDEKLAVGEWARPDPDAREGNPQSGISTAMRGNAGGALIGPAGPNQSLRDDETSETAPDADTPTPGRGQVVKGEAPESTGTRSVMIACAVGALIAAAIIWAAFLLRPATAGDMPRSLDVHSFERIAMAQR